MATPKDVLSGMMIISIYAGDEMDEDSFCSAHDQIFCGSYTGARMTAGDLEIMTGLGWFEDEDSWSIST